MPWINQLLKEGKEGHGSLLWCFGCWGCFESVMKWPIAVGEEAERETGSGGGPNITFKSILPRDLTFYWVFQHLKLPAGFLAVSMWFSAMPIQTTACAALGF